MNRGLILMQLNLSVFYELILFLGPWLCLSSRQFSTYDFNYHLYLDASHLCLHTEVSSILWIWDLNCLLDGSTYTSHRQLNTNLPQTELTPPSPPKNTLPPQPCIS